MAAEREGEGERDRLRSSVSLSSARTQTTRTTAGPSTIRTVVTSPPWARDEPPSPTDGAAEDDSTRRTSEARPRATTSYDSGSAADAAGPSRWWGPPSRHRPTGSTGPLTVEPGAGPGFSRVGRGDRARSLAWLAIPRGRPDAFADDAARPVLSRKRSEQWAEPERGRAREQPPAHLELPAPSADPLTLAHNFTPGWDTPWTPRARGASLSFHASDAGVSGRPSGEYHYDGEKAGSGPWKVRRRRARKYLIHNPYVPLLFRFINIVFTTAALALAIRIRYIEKKNAARGAVGSSPSLVIIFAPPTLIHVIVALHAEYFGRPLGLWRTSGKLAWTLVEVIFICLWSAALALCFDNYFTSMIPCASYSAIAWYDELPRPALGAVQGIREGAGRVICGDQVALIFVVGFGLMMYCFNLVISLFRIFERVKHHPLSLLQA